MVLEEQVVKAEPGEPVELEATLVTQGLLEIQELQVTQEHKELQVILEVTVTLEAVLEVLEAVVVLAVQVVQVVLAEDKPVTISLTEVQYHLQTTAPLEVANYYEI